MQIYRERPERALIKNLAEMVNANAEEDKARSKSE
jgi:hypothetical protein